MNWTFMQYIESPAKSFDCFVQYQNMSLLSYFVIVPNMGGFSGGVREVKPP